MKNGNAIRRVFLPLGIFLIVWTGHYVWHGFFPEAGSIQTRWVQVSFEKYSWWRRYIETQSYWLGFSYALSLSFAAHALGEYRRRKMCAARTLAIGGVTLSGFLAVGGCFLLGCCGSPMLGVYISLLGVAFLPWAKPLVAVSTAITIGLAWLWLRFRTRANLRRVEDACAIRGESQTSAWSSAEADPSIPHCE